MAARKLTQLVDALIAASQDTREAALATLSMDELEAVVNELTDRQHAPAAAMEILYAISRLAGAREQHALEMVELADEQLRQLQRPEGGE